MSDMWELAVCILIPLVAIILFCLASFVAVSYLDCRGFANGTGMETRWDWGCYVKTGEQWVPKQYVFGDANEIRLKARP